MKYLIVGASWVGDMVISQVLFKLIKQNTNALIDVIAPPWSLPLLIRMPEINKSIPCNIKHGEFGLRKRLQIARQLSLSKYDHAIVLPNSWKSALIPFFAGIPKRTGWRGEMRYGLLNDIRIIDPKCHQSMVQRFVALSSTISKLSPLPKPSLQINLNNKQQLIQKLTLNTKLPILALCPGAEFGPAKRWPAEYYAQVAQHFIKIGWQVWLFGSKNDKAIINKIFDNTSPKLTAKMVNLAGKTNLEDAVDLLSTAKAVISNDSGLMHIAAALELNLIAIYGSSSADFTPPLNNNNIIVNLNLDCNPCFKKYCPLKHMNCLTQLLPDTIINALNRLINNST